MTSRLLTSFTVAGILFLMIWTLIRPNSIQAVPMGRHCGDVGPLPLDDPDFCGCTWGEVLFRGQPVANASLSLSFNGQTITATSESNQLETFPFFDLTAHELGASRGDVFTLIAVYAGQTISRTIRAWPGTDGEQHVTMAFPEVGVWKPLVNGGFTRTLAIDDNILWAGGPAGLLSLDLTTGLSQILPLPWGEATVQALTVTPDSHLWVANTSAVAEWDGVDWYTHTLPFTATLRTLVASATGNRVWAGGGDTTGYVAIYDGEWQKIGEFASAPVTTMAVDNSGRLWAGTWGRGVYFQNGSGGWLNRRTTDGLPSDNVLSLTAAADEIWVGTSPYLSGQGPRGGIGKYTLSTGLWQRYGLNEGLPADTGFPQAPADVYGLAVGNGRAWAVTAQGVFIGLGERWWEHTPLHGLPAETGRAVIARGETAVVALANTLYQLSPDEMVGERPLAGIEAQTETTTTLSVGQPLVLQGTGQDNDEATQRLVGWEWWGENGRLLCSQAACTLPYEFVNLAPGVQTLFYRVQDDEGVWSESMEWKLMMEGETAVYLPLVLITQ